MVVDSRLLDRDASASTQGSVMHEQPRHWVREYLEATTNVMAGWLRVVGGYGVALAGSLTRNDQWRRQGTRTRLVGTVQCQLGARADAIERLVAGPALRHTDR